MSQRISLICTELLKRKQYIINQLMACGSMNDEYLIHPKEAPKAEKKEYRTSGGNFLLSNIIDLNPTMLY